MFVFTAVYLNEKLFSDRSFTLSYIKFTGKANETAYMKLVGVILITIIQSVYTNGFLLRPVLDVLNSSRRNLRCPLPSSGDPNDTYYGYRSSAGENMDYCVVIEETFGTGSSSYNKTTGASIFYFNEYRYMAIDRCGFSPTSDIGYGNCTPRPYETATTIELCICATMNCSISMAICRASVDQMRASSSPPPLLPVITPRFTNRITCHDNTSILFPGFPSPYPPSMNFGCTQSGIRTAVNFSRCHSYAISNSVVCLYYYLPMYYYQPPITLILKMPLFDDTYIIHLHRYFRHVLVNYSSSAEGSTNLVWTTPVPFWPLNFTEVQCFCTTNNCLTDFATCSNGLNVSQLSIPPNLTLVSTTASSNSNNTSTSDGASQMPSKYLPTVDQIVSEKPFYISSSRFHHEFSWHFFDNDDGNIHQITQVQIDIFKLSGELSLSEHLIFSLISYFTLDILKLIQVIHRARCVVSSIFYSSIKKKFVRKWHVDSLACGQQSTFALRLLFPRACYRRQLEIWINLFLCISLHDWWVDK